MNYKVFIVSSMVSLGNSQTIPADCVSWFDGCNSCNVVDGKLTVCTAMWCDGPKKTGYCTNPK